MHPHLQNALAAIPQPQSPTEALRYHTVRGLVIGYHHRWITDHPWHVLQVEETFALNILNPATGRKSRHYDHAGKWDAIAVGPPGTALIEHKTCSESIEVDSPYWKRLAIDTQISGYLLAAWQLGTAIEHCLYDVIRKPAIAPKKLGLKELNQAINHNEYFGQAITAEAHHTLYHDPEHREPPELFGIRLAYDCQERAEWYFQRQLIHRSKAEIANYATELWQQAKEIHDANKRQHFRRNDKSCFAYARPCDYLDLCCGYAQPDCGQWQRTANPHTELNVNRLRTVLTHTALSTYAQCPRKYAYRYVHGLIPTQVAEPLTFGDAIHQALAVWWASFPAQPDCQRGPQTAA